MPLDGTDNGCTDAADREPQVPALPAEVVLLIVEFASASPGPPLAHQTALHRYAQVNSTWYNALRDARSTYAVASVAAAKNLAALLSRKGSTRHVKKLVLLANSKHKVAGMGAAYAKLVRAAERSVEDLEIRVNMQVLGKPGDVLGIPLRGALLHLRQLRSFRLEGSKHAYLGLDEGHLSSLLHAWPSLLDLNIHHVSIPPSDTAGPPHGTFPFRLESLTLDGDQPEPCVRILHAYLTSPNAQDLKRLHLSQFRCTEADQAANYLLPALLAVAPRLRLLTLDSSFYYNAAHAFCLDQLLPQLTSVRDLNLSVPLFDPRQLLPALSPLLNPSSTLRMLVLFTGGAHYGSRMPDIRLTAVEMLNFLRRARDGKADRNDGGGLKTVFVIVRVFTFLATAARMFGGGSSATAPARDADKQAVFQRFKAACVPLLDASRGASNSSTTRQVVQLLERLLQLITDTPSSSFTLALANYVFFPLSSLLQPRPDGASRGDRVLEAAMQVLGTLVPKWRAAGMEQRVRQELWIMAILTLGGPLDPNKPQSRNGKVDKGKARALEHTDETKLAMVEVLLALMRADEEAKEERLSDEDDDPLGERIDWTAPDPLAPPKRPERPPFTPPPLSVLFHTLTTLLDLAAEPTSLLQLQLSSLDALDLLLQQYLARPAPPHAGENSGPSPLLATALPGTASTLTRIALSRPRSSSDLESTIRRQASGVIVSALRVLSNLIAATVGDQVTAALREDGQADSFTTPSSLEELASLSLEDRAPSENGEGDEPPPAPPDPPSAPSSGPTVPNPAWLRFTVSSLSTLFASLAPLSTHESPVVRAALVDLLAQAVAECSLTLAEQAEVPLEGLLALASDDWDDVRGPARKALFASFARPPSQTDPARHPLVLAAQIVQRRLIALPRSVRRQDEHAVRRGAGIVRVALELLPTVDTGRGGGGVLQGVERWSWALLQALELERVPAAGRAAEGGMALAWITGAGEADGGGQATSFPPVRLRAVEEDATTKALEAMWQALGRAAAAAGQEGEVVDLFLGVALGPRRGETVAPSALWVVDGVLRGMDGSEVGKGQKKVLRRAVKAVLALLEELEGDEEEPVAQDERPPAASSDALIAAEGDAQPVGLIEHKKGVVDTPSLDKYNPVAAVTTSRETRASHRLLLSALSLRLLSTAALRLMTSFQPFLMQALYHVLAHLSPTTHPFLRAHAQHALSLISDATSHASPQNLVLANVDYVVNSVSQRLSVARLEPSAPLVLVEMIRLVGRPIVPMVQDLVDDVFEALDDFHGYEDLTVGLWAVLDALLKAMEEDLPVRDEHAERKTDVVKADAEEDWRAFEAWFAHRHDKPAGDDEDEDDVEEVNPQRPFESGFTDNKSAPDGPTAFPEEDADAEKAPPPPTQAQAVTAQILAKALYFLSHPSAFLRARVLSLIASAVPLLAIPSSSSSSSSAPSPSPSSLLPIIHRAWPAILARLADPEPFVVVEAAALVESLAAHVGDFMARRILDDAWPRLKGQLDKQEKAEGQSALARRAAAGMGAGASDAGVLGKYATHHRLNRAVLRTLLHVARAVPLKEAVVWDQAVLLRRFLASTAGPGRVEPELQALAGEVYAALGRVNADAVWVVLAATVEEGEGLPRWLRMEGVDFGTNVERVLQAL
ncbi:hypothetical protein JCM10207_003024 [Rhodosporidiobolus poonsookiae]